MSLQTLVRIIKIKWGEIIKFTEPEGPNFSGQLYSKDKVTTNLQKLI